MGTITNAYLRLCLTLTMLMGDIKTALTKVKYVTPLLLMGFSASSYAKVEKFETYGNKFMTFVTWGVGGALFIIFCWGFFTFAKAMMKIPELRENANDRDAKQKVMLNMFGGLAAMVAPVLIVALIIQVFGVGVVSFSFADGADTHSDALGVLNQLESTSTP